MTHPQELSPTSFSRRYHVTGTMVRRMGLQRELRGHQGCVNCIQWNEAGRWVWSIKKMSLVV